MRTFPLSAWCIAAGPLLAGLIGFSSASEAQPTFPLGTELPESLVRACPTLEDAQLEAIEARQQAQLPEVSGPFFARNAQCHLLFAAVTPFREEAAIGPFLGWNISYDPSGRNSVGAPFLGEGVRIQVSARKQQVRYYFGNFITNKGERFSGWVELPDDPYMLNYLQANPHQWPRMRQYLKELKERK